MASHGDPATATGRRRRTRAIALSGGLAAVLALVLVAAHSTGDRWGILNSSRSSSSTPPAPTATAESRAQLARACIAQTKGEEAVAYFHRDIPADRWGDPVRGTASASSEPFVLWLFDDDCEPHKALDVPARTSRTFKAQVGQVWSYTEASAGQPADGRTCRVFGLSNSGTEQRFSDSGLLTYHAE
ncbi:hypothetical protein OG836_02685 [Micromonospora zamorensis]|uniref:hypothetical protein n=1 Tax=Micromonospora zamorensis TaxID=709883 RepID=UPI002E238E8F